ncbi:hypothetical protein BUALT_Bualt02G0068200 [Buddleja alternifolia]|uniref:Protein kinase domain-containing protein n=1 Tax=Buddleja alternifolia TaxID=168488 RepID=A0AAV6Y6L5_9LAMI|nr:hypothetical protein BUALT_Bualt02G0068200 [Buddleja alternifolia]
MLDFDFTFNTSILIANCSYLNVLKLNDNLLTGRIPQQLVTLRSLNSITVANNLLFRPVPAFPKSLMFPPEIYANNRGLCGYPLDPCESGGERDAFVSGLIVGWAAFFALSLVVGWFIPVDKFITKFIRRQGITIPRLQSPLDKFKFKFIRRRGIAIPRRQSLPSTYRIDILRELYYKIIPQTGKLISDNVCPQISMLEKFATRMSFFELSEATDNFSENNVIAIGETGTTYKGTLTNDRCLAIKRLFNSPHLEHNFQSEITTLGRFRHKTVVPLIGFCHEFDRLIIYKFMPNGSLHDCLFSSNIIMEWPLRVRIAVGIAKGIVWLHENRVVHRGISSKCVLLDENFDPKISDFGKSTTPDRTYLSWNGTLNGKFSVPSCYEEDVYGFGMVLLELVTGKKHEEFISSFESMDGGDMFELISELQATREHNDEMCHFLRIAGNCIECDPGNWPSMVEVYRMLIGTTTTRDDSDTNNEIQFAN